MFRFISAAFAQITRPSDPSADHGRKIGLNLAFARMPCPEPLPDPSHAFALPIM